MKARRQEMEAKKKRQRLVTAAIVLVSLGVLGTIVVLARQVSRLTLSEVILPESLESPADADGAAWGPVDAPVLIEEFGDFQ